MLCVLTPRRRLATNGMLLFVATVGGERALETAFGKAGNDGQAALSCVPWSQDAEMARARIEKEPLAESVPLTAWLRASGDGDRVAGERAYSLVYTELRRLAALQIARGEGHTLTPTALVSEAFLKLAGGSLTALNDRRHFFNLAARAMRQTVVDHAREHLTLKRGGQFLRTEIDEGIPDRALDAQQALAIDQALQALEQQDTQLAETMHLCVFGGLTTPQIAALRGVTERSVQRDLALARGYLRLVLEGER